MLPTASAVVGDVIDIVRDGAYNPYYSWGDADKEKIIPYEDINTKFFVRIEEAQKEKIASIFPDVEIIKGVSDYGFVSPLMSVKELDEKLTAAGGYISRIRLFR